MRAWCQKNLRNWVVALCDKIIISIYPPTFLPTSIISLLPQDLWPPYLAGWWFKVNDHLLQNHVILWSRGQVITWEMKKSYISTSTRPMANKLDRVVASDEKMLSTKSHNPFVTWKQQATWQIKNVISLFPRGLCALN